MFIKLSRAWTNSSTGEFVFVEMYGNRGYEERYSYDGSSKTTYFDNSLDAFRAMEKWHENEEYEEMA